MKKLIMLLCPLTTFSGGLTGLFAYQTMNHHQINATNDRVKYHRLNYDIGTKNKTWKFTYYLGGKQILSAIPGPIDFWQQIEPWTNDSSCQEDFFTLLQSVEHDASYTTASKANDAINNGWANIADDTRPGSFACYLISLAREEAQTAFKVDKGVVMTLAINVNLITHHTVLDAISAVKSS